MLQRSNSEGLNSLVTMDSKLFMSMLLLLTCRNSDEAVRPTFCEVVVSLQQPDFQILKWSSADEAKYSKAARTLGNPIEKGHGLHTELQRSYLRKGSADSSLLEIGTANIASSHEDSSKLRIPDTRYVLTKSDDLSTCEGASSCENSSKLLDTEYDSVYDDGYDVLSKSDDVSIDM